jgi:hypothetical protein
MCVVQEYDGWSCYIVVFPIREDCHLPFVYGQIYYFFDDWHVHSSRIRNVGLIQGRFSHRFPAQEIPGVGVDKPPPFRYHESGPEGSEEVLKVAMSTVVFWLVTAAILLAECAIIVAALRMRVDPDPTRGVLGTRPLEILWTLLPLSLIALMLILSYAELQDA